MISFSTTLSDCKNHYPCARSSRILPFTKRIKQFAKMQLSVDESEHQKKVTIVTMIMYFCDLLSFFWMICINNLWKSQVHITFITYNQHTRLEYYQISMIDVLDHEQDSTFFKFSSLLINWICSISAKSIYMSTEMNPTWKNIPYTSTVNAWRGYLTFLR